MEQNFNNNMYESEPNLQAPAQPAAEKKETRHKKFSTGLKVTALVLVVALLGGIGGGAIMASVVNSMEFSGAAETLAATGGDPADAASDLTATGVNTPILTTSNTGDKTMTPSEVYARYASAVVAISVESTTTNVFGQVSSSASSGSGFIISEDGYIVTNCHVIEDGTYISVMLFDETSYDATVVGYDTENDVALLKIDATGLNTVAIGDSDQIVVGEQVCAIGNPLGELTFTLTCGHVSALDREINTDGKPINMFQTDAAINPGNSGGPLFDMAGNVIGITTAKYASDEIEGLGFVIPINDVMKIVNDLVQYGHVVGRAYMGVQVTDMANASMYNLPDGAYIYSVEEGGCAEAAGILAGDIVTGLGDESIESYSDLVAALRNYKAGDTTTITVFQSGAYKDLTITFDERPAEDQADASTETQTPAGGSGSSGYGNWPFAYGYGYAG